jgi:hypothetical protein
MVKKKPESLGHVGGDPAGEKPDHVRWWWPTPDALRAHELEAG